MGVFKEHTPCEVCGSSDGKALYDDGSAFCFVCETSYKANGNPTGKGIKKKLKGAGVKPLIEDLEFKPLQGRGLFLETVQKFGYGVGLDGEERVQVAPYFDHNGNLVAQKLRTQDKKFSWSGNTKGGIQLYGQQLWRDKGQRVIVTEGEIDAMSVSQVFGNKWPVVSVPNGAPSAEKSIKENLEWLEQFDEVVFAFDNDEPGRKAALECAMLFKSGKAKIANFSPYKDASDYLQINEGKKIADIIFGAKTFRPDGIVSGNELTLEMMMEEEKILSYSLPYPELDRLLMGARKGEIHMYTAGSGIGKTTLVREIAAHMMIQHNLRIGYVALEEAVKKTAIGLMSVDLNVPMGKLFLHRDMVDPAAFAASHKKMVANDKLFLYDHFGSLESANLLAKLRYMAVSCGCDFIVLDHISIVVSGIEDGEERRIIDNLMTKLRELVESTGVGILAITHLKVPEGTPHEEGGRVTLSQLRGSGAIKQLSDNIIAIERNQQGEEPDESQIRVLKNRLIGDVGLADLLKYDKDTGRLLPCEVVEDKETEEEMF